MAGGAGPVGHELADLGADPFGLGLAIAAFKVADHALEGAREFELVAVGVVIHHLDLLLARAVQNDVQLFFGQFADGFVQVNVKGARCGFETLPVVAAFLFRAAPFHAEDGAVNQRPLAVWDDALGVNLQFRAESLAIGTGAVRCVE